MKLKVKITGWQEGKRLYYLPCNPVEVPCKFVRINRKKLNWPK